MEVQAFGWKVQLVVHRYREMTGVCSDLGDGSHFLMWDFDHQDQGEVVAALQDRQSLFGLPPIYVLQSSQGGGLHAYCFSRCDWMQAVYILGTTKGIDQGFLKLGFLRGYYTLRIDEKRAGDFRPVCQLPSEYPETVAHEEVGSFVAYRTMKP